MTLITLNNVNNFFNQELKALKCQEKTKAYIISILSKYRFSNDDYSNASLTLIYHEAKISRNFSGFQNLADWIFFCESVFPEHLNDASKEYYHSLAQTSYYTCYRLINKQLDIYENLADEFTLLTNSINKIIRQI